MIPTFWNLKLPNIKIKKKLNVSFTKIITISELSFNIGQNKPSQTLSERLKTNRKVKVLRDKCLPQLVEYLATFQFWIYLSLKEHLKSYYYGNNVKCKSNIFLFDRIYIYSNILYYFHLYWYWFLIMKEVVKWHEEPNESSVSTCAVFQWESFGEMSWGTQ